MTPFDCKLPIDNLFDFLSNPRDIDREELTCILWYFSITEDMLLKRIFLGNKNLKGDTLFDALVDLKFIDSKSEIRRLIKSNALKINNKLLKDENIKDVNFFKVIDNDNDLEFGVIKKGKQHSLIIFKL